MQNNNNLKDKDLGELFESLKVEVMAYADKKFRYFKLEAYEKISFIFSLIAYATIVLVLAVGLLFFGLFGAAFFLGEMLGSFAGGFGILFGFIMVVLILIMIFHRRLRAFIMNKVIVILRKIEANEDF
ncbi:hypothetical protein [Dysgonomonas sp. 25]|uniref:hypothetical protein n=1 Tax=Dysgonomonas sp. 25 TaxID=2302933 RepID=UPI0013CF6AE6|nr:hypothetical protein [Dysgonomonas sp. 25]NDV69145.1 hypothetical protein [Dysgonomonas sp. 25]